MKAYHAYFVPSVFRMFQYIFLKIVVFKWKLYTKLFDELQKAIYFSVKAFKRYYTFRNFLIV